MDSPHLLYLGFQLLALAASHPNIAMSTAGPAEETRKSSSSNTTVRVYCCKDYEISTSSCEKCEEITGTHETFFELVTNKTHVTVCFQQTDSCIERIYSVLWEKDGTEGVSCGILNSGENGRDNIITKKNICCEAETPIWWHNPHLKCYTQKSSPKLTTLPAGSPEGILGNPELVTSKNNTIGLSLAFLALIVIGGTVTCYLWRRRHRQGSSGQFPDRKNLTVL